MLYTSCARVTLTVPATMTTSLVRPLDLCGLITRTKSLAADVTKHWVNLVVQQDPWFSTRRGKDRFTLEQTEAIAVERRRAHRVHSRRI